MQDLFAKLSHNGPARAFSKLDLSGAFNQLILDDGSAKLLVLNTERSLMASRRLSFWIKTPPILFQSCKDKVSTGLSNVFCCIDDTRIVTRSLEEHTHVLSEVFDRLECEFYKGEVEYAGHQLNADVVKPLQSKVESIQKARRPENVSELKSFSGVGQLLWKVFHNLASRLQSSRMPY